MIFPVELYKEDHYRLVHGDEELKSLEADGWSQKRPDGHKYLPWSAHPSQIPPRSVRPVLAHNPAPSFIKESTPDSDVEVQAKRGPGRPPNPKE